MTATIVPPAGPSTEVVDPAVLVARVRRRPALRQLAVCAVLVGLLLVTAFLALILGASGVPVSDVVATLVGQGSSEFVVWSLRLPRWVMGALVGAELALAGAVFQTLLRNPLASPDIIGVTGGAALSAAFSTLILGASGIAVAGWAFGGALLAAAVIALLSGTGGVSGFRFVIIGISVAFVASGLLGYLIARADVRRAQEAFAWLAGSVQGATWPEIAIVAGVGAALMLALRVLHRPLSALALGDDVAAQLGVHVARDRLVLLGLAVCLAAIGCAFTGVIGFVAFASAPIARRLVGEGSLALVAAPLTGAVIVTASDLIAQHLFAGFTVSVPVGVITSLLAAPYMLWLLAGLGRRGLGG
ncbi:ABC transporter permease [Cnuibacter physcomitrellae]|uniref:FecCD family ABC transporter permease n=1 Tax=Cnuibacter physcomitrellae TaxID=1619308 RepID=UPI0019A60468|nr:iron chelate uptake ABC transporter family permease subunit [Cnuibacter physcomitrellae]GGI36242.1 ABC transporter permease [Cnuibacter physcomitrellae]